jgi:dolichol kinase
MSYEGQKYIFDCHSNWINVWVLVIKIPRKISLLVSNFLPQVYKDRMQQQGMELLQLITIYLGLWFS